MRWALKLQPYRFRIVAIWGQRDSFAFVIYFVYSPVDYIDLGNFMNWLDFSLTVEAAPHECAIRTSQP